MIGYEELERALWRWKARRAGGGELGSHEIDGDTDAAAATVTASVATVTSYRIPTGTGEIELGEAVVDEA